MLIFVSLVISHLLAFVAGLLVYRKHAAALKAKEEAVKGAFKG